MPDRDTDEGLRSNAPGSSHSDGFDESADLVGLPEPDPATLSVTQGGIGRETAPFFPPASEPVDE